MTPTPLRVALYARVSTTEQAEEGHSIDAQLRVLREFCARKGWVVVGEYVDAGVSGKTLKRPRMQDLLRDAHSTPRPFDVIAVHKLDRFSRSIHDTITTLTGLKEIGIGLASATQPIDFTTPEGKAMLMMLAVFAEIYIDNLSAESAKGREQRARKGFWNGSIPFGYKAIKQTPSSDDERMLQFHPENIEAYRLAICMCAEGKRISEIMNTLNAQGYRSTSYRGVRPFSKDMLMYMLKNRFYLGEVQYKGEWMPGKHPPAIDLETWERAQQQIERRTAQKTDHHTQASRPYVLRGLLYCAECGNRLRGWTNDRQIRHYRDPAQDNGCQCSQIKAIRAERLEGQVSEILARLRLPGDWLERALVLLGENADDNAQREKQRASLEGQLDRLRVMFQLGDITEQAYRSERDRIRREISAARPVKHFDIERAAQVMQNFGELWNKATLTEQEEIAHAIFEKLYTYGGKIIAIEPKPDFYPLLAVAAQDAGIGVADGQTIPVVPVSDTSPPVLVIVPPTYLRTRASESTLRDSRLRERTTLPSDNAKDERRSIPQPQKKKHATPKRGTPRRARTGE